MGNIGKERRRIEVLPAGRPERAPQPSEQPAPSAPEREPAPAK